MKRIVNNKAYNFTTIYTDELSKFEAVYKKHDIDIEKGKHGNYYIQCNGSDGLYIMDGYYEYNSIDECILYCINNI